MLCPHCGKEVVTPIVNAVVPNINGAAQPVVTHLNLVFSADDLVQVYSSNINANGCNPTAIPQIVTIPPR